MSTLVVYVDRQGDLKWREFATEEAAEVFIELTEPHGKSLVVQPAGESDLYVDER